MPAEKGDAQSSDDDGVRLHSQEPIASLPSDDMSAGVVRMLLEHLRDNKLL